MRIPGIAAYALQADTTAGMQGPGELAIPAAVESVTDDPAAAGGDRAGSG